MKKTIPIVGSPVGVDDTFGARARSLRKIQHDLLALFASSEYEEVIPPIVERPESLELGAGSFLIDQTVTFSDPAGAGLLAIRSDMTPQLARIAATRLDTSQPLRLSYSGMVMQARPDPTTASRMQWQTGLECFGIAGADADAEVIELAAQSMLKAGFSDPVFQLGHLGLLRALLKNSQHSFEVWVSLIRRRSLEDLEELVSQDSLNTTIVDALRTIVCGEADLEWLDRAQSLSAAFSQTSSQVLDLIRGVNKTLSGKAVVQFDAAVLPRYLYHSGIIFSGFARDVPMALLHGGRYDELMHLHGKDVPATGFSLDLWAWVDALEQGGA